MALTGEEDIVRVKNVQSKKSKQMVISVTMSHLGVK